MREKERGTQNGEECLMYAYCNIYSQSGYVKAPT